MGIYDVNGTELLYDGVQTVDGAQKGVLYAYDFETAESRMLPLGTSDLTRLMRCGEYYIAETYASHGTPNTERFTTYYTDTVYDSEWNQIASAERPENAVFGNMKVHDGSCISCIITRRTRRFRCRSGRRANRRSSSAAISPT